MRELLASRLKEKIIQSPGFLSGHLSGSAVAAAVAIVALQLSASADYQELLERARAYLLRTRLSDGGWGDTPESPANLTATLLSYVALRSGQKLSEGELEPTESWLRRELSGSLEPASLAVAVRAAYGRDLTFSAPILALCAAAGLMPWALVPRLPYELALLPPWCFRFLRLPVVSYAIPALLAVGLARSRPRLLARRCLAELRRRQPAGGGYLEAVPLTSFCSVCLLAAGYGDHPVVRDGLRFIVAAGRPDGSFPIDSNLEIWLTALSVRALGADAFSPAERERLCGLFLQAQQTARHPFNAAPPGGWGWTSLSGAVPDADDTAAVLSALAMLQPQGAAGEAVEQGLRWLLAMQNGDGGVATFCRGWNHLPFDRSSPDISGHAYRCFSLWQARVSPGLAGKLQRARRRISSYLAGCQQGDGAWRPLWFGDQEAPGQEAPVYGTALILSYLHPDGLSEAVSSRAWHWLLAAQNADGGWGGAPGAPSKVTMTARAVAALKVYWSGHAARERGLEYMRRHLVQAGPEPIGLYFAKLWYDEPMYLEIFALEAFT